MDRVRAMFDLIGTNIKGIFTDASKSNEKVALKRRPTSQMSHMNSEQREIAKAAEMLPEIPNVFAPHLLPATSVPLDRGFDQHLLAVNAIINERHPCAVYLIHCALHNKVAVSKPSEQQAMWMPFMPTPPDKSWHDSGLAGLYIILSESNMDLFLSFKRHPPYAEMHLIEVFDVQLPRTFQVATRLTWYVRLDHRVVASHHFKCCHDTPVLRWIAVQDIISQNAEVLEHLWGNELLEKMLVVNACYEAGQTPCGTFDQYNLDMAFKHMPHNPPIGDEEQLLVSANLSKKDVERLYADFLDHCFPCTVMAPHSFRVYMTKYGLKYTDERQWAFFRAFNYHCNGVITFPELLMGLACIDSKSKHNATRAKFVIRYYDVYNRGYLTEDDLRLIIFEMHQGKDITDGVLEEKLAEMLRGLETEVDSNTQKICVRHGHFLAGILNHQVRGTSHLCRIGRPICALISNAVFVRTKRRNSKLSRHLCNVVEKQYAGMCLGCTKKRPVLSDTLAKLSSDGCFISSAKVPELKTLSPTSSGSTSKVRQKSNKKVASAQKPSKKREANSKSKSLQRQPSLESTSSINVVVAEKAINEAKRLLKLIHQFAPMMGDTRNPAGLLTDRPELLLEQLKVIEDALEPLLTRCRSVPVNSPAIVIGDIHGNLADLLTLEKNLWKRFPLVGPNLVFLGDIVDRGKWGVECAVYVFCLILLAPHSVTLLRGNHEVRELQCRYTYRQECLVKYGQDHGNRLWKLTNRIFDRLPICAVIDEAIYCAHGGIPRTVTNLKDVETLPSVVSNPLQESPIIWEILWSDPMAPQLFLETAQLLQVDVTRCNGFLFNRKRGTAWSFNEQALDRFLAANELTHMVRAHEVPNNGFFFHFDKKCATIFSCSHYCGNANECAVLFVDRDQLRVIRVDTKDNASATD